MFQYFAHRFIRQFIMLRNSTGVILEQFIGLNTAHKQQSYKGGKLEGVYKSWFENGQLKQDHIYKDGKLEGVAKWWFENGQLNSEGNYKDGKLEEVEEG